MTREETTNSQDYKATKAALEWWYSLSEEQRKATDIDAEPDIVDAYAEGVIYGWNNPQWRPVENELPPAVDKTVAGREFSKTCLVCTTFKEYYSAYYVYSNDEWGGWYDEDCNEITDVTHWMEIVPPRKEE